MFCEAGCFWLVQDVIQPVDSMVMGSLLLLLCCKVGSLVGCSVIEDSIPVEWGICMDSGAG